MGEPVLRQKSRALTQEEIKDSKTKKLINDMIETVKSEPEEGFINVGISAPQVFQPLRIFLLMDENSKFSDQNFIVYINPQLEIMSDKVVEDVESCLSTPKLCGNVKRHTKVKLTYLDIDGNKCRKKLSGDFAVYAQHEYDHLEGILWVDRVTDPRTMYYT